MPRRAVRESALTIHVDGGAEPRLVGASSFPRHWVYDHTGRLVAKSGFIDHDSWWREAFGSHTPWGAEDSAPIVTAVESALERQLSVAVIDARPRFRRLQAGRTLVQQGDPATSCFCCSMGCCGSRSHAGDREQVDDRAGSLSQLGPDTDNQGDKQQVVAEHVGERTPAKQLRPGGSDSEQTHGIQQPIQPELACGQEQHAAQPTDQNGQDCRDTGDPAEEHVGGIHAPPNGQLVPQSAILRPHP